MAEKKKKYIFTRNKNGKTANYYKDEHELTKNEHEMLYQDFAQHWDNIPLKAKNRFLQWVVDETAKAKKIAEN